MIKCEEFFAEFGDYLEIRCRQRSVKSLSCTCPSAALATYCTILAARLVVHSSCLKASPTPVIDRVMAKLRTGQS